jgi:hypothetical protein
VSSSFLRRHSRGLRPAAAASAAVLVAASLATIGLSTSASATTTVAPVEAGSPPVVRDASVNITLDRAGQTFYRSNSSGSFAAQASTVFLLPITVCRGDNPAGTNASPRSVVTVKDPDGATLLSTTSPVRDVTVGGFLTSPPNGPSNPQPAPSNTNYRGDFANNTHHGIATTLNLSGKPAGVYTVTTTTTNTVKTGLLGACSIGTPGPGNTVVPGPVVETQTFEYRPWAYNFKDVLGGGRVHANFDPSEVQVSIGSKTSPVLTGSQRFYSLDIATLPLPSDPVACATDPTTCLPITASPCDPGDGCTPRVMIVSRAPHAAQGDPYGLQGIFDLETKAFIALANVDGTKRTLVSLGNVIDPYYDNLLGSLSEQFASQGNDLPAILGTTIELRSGTETTSLSLLNGLQIDPSSTAGGISIRTAGTVQAGVLLDIYSHARTSGGACVTNTASSANGDRSYTPNEDAGYTVRTSDLLPSVPRVGPLGAIVGGPVYSIFGDFKGATAPLVNTASAVIGVDTAADEPNGYPVWIEPFLSSPNHVAAPKTMDYLGTATWSASESPLLGTGCLVVDFMVGTGAAIFDNPLAYGFEDLIDPISAPNAAVRSVMDAVDEAVVTVLDTVTANPVVSSVLTDVIGQLPLSDLP